MLRTLLHVAVQRNITDAHLARKGARTREGWKSYDAPPILLGRRKLLPDKLCRKFGALQKRIPAQDSRKLSLYTFSLSLPPLPFLARFFIRSSRLPFSFVRCLFSFGVPDHYELASNTYRYFQQNRTFLLRLTFLKWFSVRKYCTVIPEVGLFCNFYHKLLGFNEFKDKNFLI